MTAGVAGVSCSGAAASDSDSGFGTNVMAVSGVSFASCKR